MTVPSSHNLQGIHHTYIQGSKVRLLNYMCLASTANRISDLQFTKLSLPPSGFALWLIQRLLCNMCFVMKMKREKYIKPPSLSSIKHCHKNKVFWFGRNPIGDLQACHLRDITSSLADSFPNWQCFTENLHLSKPTRKGDLEYTD